jgi:hypothetical protein
MKSPAHRRDIHRGLRVGGVPMGRSTATSVWSISVPGRGAGTSIWSRRRSDSFATEYRLMEDGAVALTGLRLTAPQTLLAGDIAVLPAGLCRPHSRRHRRSDGAEGRRRASGRGNGGGRCDPDTGRSDAVDRRRPQRAEFLVLAGGRGTGVGDPADAERGLRMRSARRTAMPNFVSTIRDAAASRSQTRWSPMAPRGPSCSCRQPANGAGRLRSTAPATSCSTTLSNGFGWIVSRAALAPCRRD